VSHGLIRDNVAAFPVSVMCEVLAVSRSGYYDWASRPRSAPPIPAAAAAMAVRGCMPSCARMAIVSAASTLSCCRLE
jgi:hypothetical protein